jgi:UDP-N-acetylmuramate dehydrogenase
MQRDDSFRESLRNLISGEVRVAEPAARHASIGAGGEIAALAFPRDEAEVGRLVSYLTTHAIPFLPVGNWTNLIVRDGGYRGVLISLAKLKRLTCRDGADGGFLLEAEAGVSLADLVGLSLQEALTGLEFCAGIPGSVGGAVRMNAGAYGGEIKDVCVSARLLAAREGARTVIRDALPFSYRNLDLPAEMVIIGAAFRLMRGEATEIRLRVQENLARRREKHPLEFPNAGSIFKNPPGIPAGRLIEEAGLKGLRLGDAQVSEKHGNFIVNRGQATAGEILSLIGLVQERVLAETGHALETEVRIIGECGAS